MLPALTEWMLELGYNLMQECLELDDDNPDDFAQRLEDAFWFVQDRYDGQEPSCGTERATFFDDHFVVKIPVNYEGVRSNYCEIHMYDRYLYRPVPGGVVPAKCWLIEDWSEQYRVPIIGMVRMVKTFSWGNLPTEFTLPAWCEAVDSKQVGIDPEGKLVAYDFGS